MQNQGWYVNGRLNSQLSLRKNWKLQFNGFTNGKVIQLQGRTGGYWLYSIGVRKDFTNQRGSLGLTIDNFLQRSVRVSGEFISPLFYQSFTNQFINRGIRLTFSYRLGKMGTDTRAKK